ncbi:ABC transporter permease [Polynucleobacter sp. MWH-P3-07-1]|uniref:ABC transporter permease n=1 Tax=Polynucleobacter sp. MWH-P3-07-1 TaxID=1743173 RepID=UPI001BFE1B50|nr:ABC transporter permease [Polynucleobacter sp. MWH-P3-07-1]QWD83818.1 ABC transporter permease [Polynucleobacter sp. MWH-P3-07-1]
MNINDLRIAEIMIKSNLKIRYKRTILGLFWSLLNPLLSVSFISLIWSALLGQTYSTYFLQLFPAYLSWQLFSSLLTGAAGSMTGNEGLIKKVPINLEIFLLVNLGNHLIDFFVSIFTLTLLVAIITFASSSLPDLGFLLATSSLVIFAYSAGMILSVLNVYYRDVGYLLGIALQILFFMTPVLYTKRMLVGDRTVADLVVSLNPLSYMVEFIRDGFSGNTTNYPVVILVLLCCILFYMFSKYIFSVYRSKIPLYL